MTVSTELAVIINSCNRYELLSEALPSVLNSLYQLSIHSTIVVFDAGSTDGSVEFIHTYSQKTSDIPIHCLTPSPEIDRSFSAGCNYAVAFAYQQYPKLQYCFLYETDNLINNPSALTLAIQLLEKQENLAAVGFTVERCNNQKAGFGCRFPTIHSFIFGQQLTSLLKLGNMEISEWHDFQGTKWGISDVVYSSPLLIRHSMWQATHGMDATKFPFSDCDVDWCWSVYKRGYFVAVLDVPGIIHDNRTQISIWSANRVIDFHRARLRLLLKHYGYWVINFKYILWLRHLLEAIILLTKLFFSEYAQKSFKQRLILLKTVLNSYDSE